MVVLLEYEWQPTFLHKMHVVPKILICSALSLIGGEYQDPLYLMAILAVELIICIKARVPRWWYALFWSLAILRVVSTFYVSPYLFMWDPRLYVVYPAELVSITILELFPEGFPLFGRVAFTVGTTLLFVSQILRNLCLITAMFALAYSTSPAELTNWMAGHRFSPAIIFLPTAIIRFSSIFQRELLTIVNAQKLRGWTAGSPFRNPVRFARAYMPLMNPVFQSGIRTSSIVTLGMDIRAFGSGRLSPATEWRMSARDKALSIATIAFSVIAFYVVFVPPYIGRL